MSTEPDWKARAEAAESRVKELEAQEPVLFVVGASLRRRLLETDDAELAKKIAAEYNKLVFPLYAAPVPRLTVTDEMARDLLDFVGAVAGENRPSREWAVRLRAALTAALEKQEPKPINPARFRRAPCYRCGYNGPGYFQAETHPCAEEYHRVERLAALENRHD